MRLQEYIIEAKTKPSFVQYFFAKKNYTKLQKEFTRWQEDYAIEYGNDIVDQEYSDEEEYEEIDPVTAYDNYAHTMGYQAEYDAATQLVSNHKNKYNYQRGDENESSNPEMIEDLISYMGYSTSFGYITGRGRGKKEDFWKMAEE